MANKPSTSKLWTIFMSRCFEERLPAIRFVSLVSALREKQPVPGNDICRTLLKSQCGQNIGLDPLVVLYIDKLLMNGHLDGSDILATLLDFSHFQPKVEHPSQGDGDAVPAQGMITAQLEEALLGLLAKSYVQGAIPRSRTEVQRCLKSCVAWLNSLISANTDALLESIAGSLKQTASETIVLRLGFGNLLISILENARVAASIGPEIPKDTSSALSKALSSFLPILAEISIQHANRLDLAHKSHSYLFDISHGSGGDQADQLSGLGQVRLSEITDTQMVHTRAHLFLYLDAILTGLPVVNDSAMQNYLQARFKSNEDSLIVDLTTAAFDLLAIASHRGDTPDKLFVPRLFVVNKLPLLLRSISAVSFTPLSFEFLLSTTLSRLDPILFPSFSQGFGMGISGSILSEVRQDFLFACALHEILPEESIERLLGEDPMKTLQDGGKLVKDDLVAEYRNNSKKIAQLVNGLKAMDGNAQAVADAVTELLHEYCNANETSSLKSLCSVLSLDPSAIDALALLIGLGNFLAPLCRVLDDWQHGEEHGEHRLVYEEFSACCLLLMASVRRYNVRIEDLGLENQDGIAANLIGGRLVGQALSDLSEADKNHVDAWIRELFENEAISDESLGRCPPQQFYKLAPTVLKQSIIACKHHGVEVSSLKSGLELLLHPILLPSLIASIEWLCTHMWEQHGDRDVVLPILEKLIYPKHISGDASTMHDTFLEVIAIPLKQSLDQDNAGDDKKLSSILTKLRPHLDYCQALGASRVELKSWSSDMRASLFNRIRTDLNALVFWSSAINTADSPLPSYSHRQLCAAVQICGANAVIRELIQWIATNEDPANRAVALDIATALVCTPIQNIQPSSLVNSLMTSQKGGTTASMISDRCMLRVILKVELEDAADTILKQRISTEAAVQLSRRVEAQLREDTTITDLNIDMPADIMQEMDLVQAAGEGGENEGGVVVGAATSEQRAQQAGVDELGLDFSNTQDMLGLVDLDAALIANQDTAATTGATGTLEGNEGVMMINTDVNNNNNNNDANDQFGALPGSAEDDIFSGLELDWFEEE